MVDKLISFKNLKICYVCGIKKQIRSSLKYNKSLFIFLHYHLNILQHETILKQSIIHTFITSQVTSFQDITLYIPICYWWYTIKGKQITYLVQNKKVYMSFSFFMFGKLRWEVRGDSSFCWSSLIKLSSYNVFQITRFIFYNLLFTPDDL